MTKSRSVDHTKGGSVYTPRSMPLSKLERDFPFHAHARQSGAPDLRPYSPRTLAPGLWRWYRPWPS